MRKIFVLGVWHGYLMEISVFSFVLSLALAMLIGALIGYALSRPRTRALQAALEDSAAQLSQANVSQASAIARSERLEEENDALIERANHDSNVLRALAPLAQQLEAMGTSMQKLRELHSEQGARISQQLATTHQLHVTLQEETHALNTALTSTSARGYWGEIELQRLVESTGMIEHVDFDKQQSTSAVSSAGSKARPDVTIHLPGDTHIAIDAKAPLSALLEAAHLQPHEKQQRAELLARHAKAFKSHVNELAQRDYPADFPGSPAFTLMFIPAESLLSDALEATPNILEYALERSIIPVTPSTLLLTLRTIATMWVNAKVNEESEEIIKLGTTLTQRLTIVAKHLDAVGNNLSKAVSSYNKTVASIESRLITPIRDFEALDTPKTPRTISPDDGQIRSFVALPLDEPTGTD